MSGLFGSTKQTSTSKTDPYAGLPDWALEYYKDEAERGGDIMTRADGIMDQMSSPDSVAGINGREQSAVNAMLAENGQAQNLVGLSIDSVMGNNGKAENLLGRSQTAQQTGINKANNYDTKALDAMKSGNADAQALLDRADGALGGEKYMSGYTDDVVNTTLAGMDRKAMQERVARGNSEASIGGLSSTRGAVSDALSSQLLSMDRAQMEASLRNDAFEFGTNAGFQESGQLQSLAGSASAMGQSEADTYRSVGASKFDMYNDKAGLLADNAANFSAMGASEADRILAAANTGINSQDTASQYQATLGETQRGLDQQEIDAPQDALDWYGNLYSGTRGLSPTGAGSTTSTQPGPSVFSQALGAASTGAGIWSAISDENAKEDITENSGALDKLEGLSDFSYNYKEGFGHTKARTSGLMAQHLERSGITGAVSHDPDGTKRVDPYPVLATVVAAVNELKREVRGGRGLS